MSDVDEIRAATDAYYLDDAISLVRSHGYVVLREGSHRYAQRQRLITEARARWADADAEHAREWARNCLDEERRLRERLTQVWGIAVEHGATLDELRAVQP
jgi:hypothetical protein